MTEPLTRGRRSRRVLSGAERMLEIAKAKDLLPEIKPAGLPFYLEAMRHEKLIRFEDKVVINTFLPPFPSRAFTRFMSQGLLDVTSCHVVTTNACHGKCGYCNFTRSEKDVATRDLVRIIGEVQDLGASVIGFTGGESLLREDLEDIVAAVDDRSSTILYTSGHGLTPGRAAGLKRAGLFICSISLDHSDREANDAKRFPGCYDMVLEAVENALDAGLYTVLSVVATPESVDGLEDFIRFADGLGVHGVRVLDLVPSGASIDSPALSARLRQRLVEMHKTLNARPELPQLTTFSHFEGRDLFGCGAGGIHHMYVDGSGRLRPCDFVPITFGNLLEEPLAAAYERMRRCFRTPRDLCFMKRRHAEVSQLLDGRQTVTAEEAAPLLRRASSDRMPDFLERFFEAAPRET